MTGKATKTIEYTLHTESTLRPEGKVTVYTLVETTNKQNRLIVQTTSRSIVEAIIKSGKAYAL